jgi:predicted CXXCH cytochrome family protein
MRFQLKKIFIITLVVSGFLIIACTPQKKYRVLSFFFDGVPEPISEHLTISLDSVSNNDDVNVALGDKKTELYLHEPYKDCENCHTPSSMGSLNKKQPALCYNCHDNMSESYDKLHGPVQGGYCTSCHNPHKSKIQNLLVEEGQKLCFKCHEISAISQSNMHADIGETDCINCHNPHGGVNKNYMVKGSCLNCHDNFDKKFTYVHGPVAGGFCGTCHSSHASSADKLLLRTGQDLCTYCHDKSLVLKNESHEGIEDMSCMECHNPHGGEDRFIFN